MRRFIAPSLALGIIAALGIAATATSDPATGIGVPTLAEHNALEGRVSSLEARVAALEAEPTTSPSPTPSASESASPSPTQPTSSPTAPTPTVTSTPTPTATATPPVGSSLLPYTADSFYKSRVDGAGVPIDQVLTAEMRNFMATYSEQAATTWPKINLNPGWSGHNYVHRAGDAAPVWKLASNAGGTADSRLNIVRTQGVHIADDVWSSVPTGTQDRLLVLQDHVFGYTVQCADVVPDKAARTWTASNCGILWHSSNGLDYRNPRSNDPRNFTSRGRLIDAMQIPREELDRAIANGTGVGHVLHLFWVRTHQPHGHSHPMVNEESEVGGWGGEGWRLRLKPGIDLVARGLTGATLALARTLQQHGAYIGDNSGSTTQIKVGPPSDYTGTNLATDAFKGKITWADFEVVQPGWQ